MTYQPINIIIAATAYFLADLVFLKKGVKSRAFAMLLLIIGLIVPLVFLAIGVNSSTDKTNKAREIKNAFLKREKFSFFESDNP